MSKQYKGYSLFDDVKQDTLKVFNRCVTLGNINDDLGKAHVSRYLNLLTDKDKLKISVMLQYIKAKGIESVKREVSREAYV